MQREFLFNLLLLLLINLLVKPFFIFGIDLQVQNRLPLGEYGLYFALLNLAYLFQIVADFGLQSFNNRQVSQHSDWIKQYLPVLLRFKIGLSIAYVAITVAAAYGIAGYDGRALRLLLILLLNQVLAQGVLFLRTNLSGLGYYRLDSLLSSLDKLLMLLTCSVLLWVVPSAYLSAEAFAWAQTAALAIALIVVGAAVRWKAHFRWSCLFRSAHTRQWRVWKRLFRESAPYALAVLLMSAYARLDGILLERLLPEGRYHADVYASAYRLLDASNMLGYLFATLLLPMFARQLAIGVDPKPLTALAARLMWVGAIALAVSVFFSRVDLLHWMMPDRADAYRWNTLGILIWAFVPMGLTHIFSTLLTADGRLLTMSRFFVGAIALDVLLNLWLVPRYQATGAAITAVCVQAFVAASMIALCWHRFRWSLSNKTILAVGAYPVLLAVASVGIELCTSAPWWARSVALLVVGFLLSLLLRLIPFCPRTFFNP